MNLGITELLIILVIVILLFGTKKLRSLGSDIGGAIKSLRSAMAESDEQVEAGSSKDNDGKRRADVNDDARPKDDK